MTTKTRTARRKANEINTRVKIGRAFVYVTATGFRLGRDGKVGRDVSSIYQQLSKSDARKIRKALYSQGLIKMAAARR